MAESTPPIDWSRIAPLEDPGSRHYEGPGLGEAPWKCPACAVENAGPLDQGCVSCGSGSARPYKVAAPPSNDLHLDARSVPNWILQADAAAAMERSPAYAALKADMQAGADLYTVADAWAAAHDQYTLVDAFIAGVQYAQQRTMAAPPVTTDVPALAPAGRPRRTIIAALELFKDQVLRGATEEIAMGEWLTVEEVDQLIQQLRAEEESGR